MAKTFFASGVVVQPKWFNGAQNIYFDGLDEDWHYPQLTNDQVQLTGDGGFDKTFVTLDGIPQTLTSTKTFAGTVIFSGTTTSPGSNALWDARLSDNNTFLEANSDTVATNQVVYEHGLIVDGGSID